MKRFLTKLQGIVWLSRAKKLGLSYHQIVILIVISLMATVTEVIGIGVFLPIFQFIRLEGDLNALVGSSIFWQYLIDWFAYFNIETSLVVLLLVSFSFFMFRQLFTYVRLVYQATVTQYITQIQRNRMFSGYIKADTAYHDEMPVGNLVNIITTEVNNAVMGILAPMELIVYTIMLFSYTLVLLLLSWEMTVVSLIVLLIASRAPNIWVKKTAGSGRNIVKANTALSKFLVERLRSPRLVRLAGTEAAEQKEFYTLTQTQRKHSVFMSILRAKTEVSMDPVVIGMSLVFLYFAYTVLHMQIEMLGLYLVVALRLMPIIKGVITQWQSLQRFLGSMEAVEDRYQTMMESVEKDTGTKFLSQLKQSILIDNVSYRYPAGKDDALKDITIEFEVGAMTAIVGASGSGKSTLIDLLPRLRLPISGVIRVDGESIEKFRLKSLRQLISYVPQSPQIFDGTVRNHILYGKSDATDEEVQEAVYLSGAKEFINQLPQGLETNLGEDAVKLSGGQRQRLDLARALVGKAKILILDEPTSNLDAESEERFKQVLSRIRKDTNTTIIIVAHRLASIVDANQIVILNHGVVEAIGKHAELLKQQGWYAKAWKIQNAQI
jgi:ABC-type multidrug transport system fused ATPase/permease subunit